MATVKENIFKPTDDDSAYETDADGGHSVLSIAGEIYKDIEEIRDDF